MSERTPIMLTHGDEACKDFFVINWGLGNICNYKCSYCPDMLHNASHNWPLVEDVISFCDKIIEKKPAKHIYIEFTGGEISLWKDFKFLCKELKKRKVIIGCISNGSPNKDWWHELVGVIDHLCLSFHSEYCQVGNFIEVMNMMKDHCRLHVNVMMNPKKFDLCLDFINDISMTKNISLSLQPLVVDLRTQLFPYSKEQLRVLTEKKMNIELSDLMLKSSYNPRGSMRFIYANNETELLSPEGIIGKGLNNWLGWKCFSGVEQIIIDMDGKIWRGWCFNGGCIGHINDSILNLPAFPMTCTENLCTCNFDIMSTKEKR